METATQKPSVDRRQAVRKPTARSRVNNGRDVLPNVDGRSLVARRYRDVAAAGRSARRWGGFRWAEQDDGPDDQLRHRGRRQSLVGRRAHQRDCVSMANKLGQLRVVPKPQREHVATTLQYDCLPPAVFEARLRNHQMDWRDLVPAAGEAGRSRKLLG